MIHPSPVRLVEKEAQRRLVLALACSSWAGSVDLQARGPAQPVERGTIAGSVDLTR